VQTTIYYSEQDAYLISQLDMKGRHERKSRSALILSIMEEYFEREKRLGEILLEQGAIDPNVLERALVIQGRNSTKGKMASMAL